MVFFSIIIPVYNVENWIDRCLESILTDQCTDMELILVDDGSQDRSGEICDCYAASHANIRVIHKENGGLSSARNAGLEQARGEWISFIDSDDWVDRDSYHTLKSFLTSLGGIKPDMVKFGYKKIGSGTERDFMPCVPEGEYCRSEIIQKLLPVAFGGGRISDSTIHSFVLSSCAHIYHRDFLEQTGERFISERKIGSEDFLFLYRLYLQASCVYVTHRTWYNYDTREGSLTRRYRENLFAQYRRLGSLVFRELKKNKMEKLLADDFKVLYIGLMYVCIMNECVGPGSRLKQAARVRRILKDQNLQRCLCHLWFPDIKSNVIASCMRASAALPLCIIQWRKSGMTI